jgi:hypothetical protein
MRIRHPGWKKIRIRDPGWNKVGSGIPGKIFIFSPALKREHPALQNKMVN